MNSEMACVGGGFEGPDAAGGWSVMRRALRRKAGLDERIWVMETDHLREPRKLTEILKELLDGYSAMDLPISCS